MNNQSKNAAWGNWSQALGFSKSRLYLSKAIEVVNASSLTKSQGNLCL